MFSSNQEAFNYYYNDYMSKNGPPSPWLGAAEMLRQSALNHAREMVEHGSYENKRQSEEIGRQAAETQRIKEAELAEKKRQQDILMAKIKEREDTKALIGDSAATSSLLERAFTELEYGEWPKADIYFEKVLDREPRNANAYLGVVCADLKVKFEKSLSNIKDPDDIKNHKYYMRAIADPVVKLRLDGYIKNINDRIAAEQLDEAERKLAKNALHSAYEIMNSAQNPDGYRKAIDALNNMLQTSNRYIDLFTKIDIVTKISICERLISEYEKTHETLYKLLEKHADLQEQRKTDETKIMALNSKKKAAVDAECARLQEKYDNEYDTWSSKALIAAIQNKKAKSVKQQIPPKPTKPQMPEFTPHKMNAARYTTGIRATGNTRVKIAGMDWLVLEVKADKVLLITENVIEFSFHDDESLIYRYLDGRFFNKLGIFRGAVAKTEWRGSEKVFLPSVGDACRWFGGGIDDYSIDDIRSGKIDDFNNTKRIAYDIDGKESRWWLNSRGDTKRYVTHEGKVSCDPISSLDKGSIGIRPALWLNISKPKQAIREADKKCLMILK